MASLYTEKKSSSCGWDDLNPEILALILVQVPIEERVGSVPLVCKNWLACVIGPYCWSEIDIQQWCRKRHRSVEEVDSAARKLMKRSRGSFGLLSAYKLGNPGFAFAANWGKYLKVLKIPMSDVSDEMVEKHAGSLANLSSLDISHCLKITSKGIGEFGKNCKELTRLKRNMPPPLETNFFEEIDFKVDDSEAIAIANTMPKLTEIELCYGSFGDLGLKAILTNCKALTHLNIEGSWKVRFENYFIDDYLELELFVGPWIDEELSDFEDNTDDEEEFTSLSSD